MMDVITCTSDRPVAMEICELQMLMQTARDSIRWIVVDDGVTPCRPETADVYIRRKRTDAGDVASFIGNLRAGLDAVESNTVAVMEDDDWRSGDYFAWCIDELRSYDVVGEKEQWYYNLAHRCWRKFENVGSCLCQTAFRASMIEDMKTVMQQCEEAGSFGVDQRFWRIAMRDRRTLLREGKPNVIGIKGLPGRVGLGVGHRPKNWTDDASGVVLREWVGHYADLYEAVFTR